MAKEDNKSFSKRSGGGVGGGDANASTSRPRPAILDTSNISRFGSSSTMVTAAREKAAGLASAARDWLQPNWPAAPMAHLDSLTTVMFSPLAAHPVYRSESMVKAIQLAQQQQRHSASPTSPSNNSGRSTELVLHNTTGSSYPWPASSVLLKADIPEATSSLSLFQGFATTYPSLASRSSTKKSKHRKKKQPLELSALEGKRI
jgi:division protein 1